ncbi:MAG: hypothetical protein WD490_09045 [Opitutales bacterium]
MDVSRYLLPFFALLLFLPNSPALGAALTADEIIAKAREYLGGEQALDAIHSIHYEGTFEIGGGETGDVEIIFQKPLQQRVKIVRQNLVEITGLNQYDGWRKIMEADNESNWRTILMDPEQLRELRANTWENLNFFKGIESRRGRIENEGVVQLGDKECLKLIFVHPRDITFARYFDRKSGRLLMTRTAEGGEIQEEGEMIVSGVRFPKQITLRKDGVVLNRITFHRITLNKTFDSELFDVPSLSR